MKIEPFENAIARLREGLARYELDRTDTQIRDGLVQRFEFTYEISHKTLKRYLESISPTPEDYDPMPFADVIREASEKGLLLGDWPDWRRYRELRSKTSHSYAEAAALEVVAGIPAFLKEVTFLADELKRRLT
jgi:nucleotidyltransferase substrate binding protein (TIGR01987 family)